MVRGLLASASHINARSLNLQYKTPSSVLMRLQRSAYNEIFMPMQLNVKVTALQKHHVATEKPIIKTEKIDKLAQTDKANKSRLRALLGCASIVGLISYCWRNNRIEPGIWENAGTLEPLTIIEHNNKDGKTYSISNRITDKFPMAGRTIFMQARDKLKPLGVTVKRSLRKRDYWTFSYTVISKTIEEVIAEEQEMRKMVTSEIKEWKTRDEP